MSVDADKPETLVILDCELAALTRATNALSLLASDDAWFSFKEHTGAPLLPTLALYLLFLDINQAKRRFNGRTLLGSFLIRSRRLA